MVANVGDSRALISRGGKAFAVSHDHKPDPSDERQHIKDAGGFVLWAGMWRVGGVLTVSRAFCDKLFKQYVVADTEIQEEKTTGISMKGVKICGIPLYFDTSPTDPRVLDAMLPLPHTIDDTTITLTRHAIDDTTITPTPHAKDGTITTSTSCVNDDIIITLTARANHDATITPTPRALEQNASEPSSKTRARSQTREKKHQPGNRRAKSVPYRNIPITINLQLQELQRGYLSDTGKSRCLVLPKNCAEIFFPSINDQETKQIVCQDTEGEDKKFKLRSRPKNMGWMYGGDIYKDLGVIQAIFVIETNSFVNPSPKIGKSKVVSLPCNITFDVIYVLLACNITTDITFDNLTKAYAARRLSIENPKPTETPPTTPSLNVNPTPTATIQEPTNETNQQPPSTNVDTTPQTEKTDLQNTNNISPVISNEFTDKSAASIQETTYETPKQSPEIQEKAADDDGKKRKRTKTESSGTTTRGSESLWEKKLEFDSPREYDDEFLKAFKEQFHGKKYITISDLSKQIQRITNTDFMFQMNYLMLFSNYMIHCNNSSRLIYYVIKNIKSTDIINDFDWCKFIWDHIQTSKTNWDDMTQENWYYRPNIVLKEAAEEKQADKDSEMRQAAEKEAVEKEAAEKELAAKEKKEAKKIAAAKKKEQAKKLAAAKKEQDES
ncbi:probable protein phosphatase 2C 59 [Tanacetum coccineum]